MATRVDLSHFSLSQLKRPTPKTPPHRKNLLHIISVTSRVVANFMFKFVTFRYCVNKSWSSKRQIANTNKPLFGAKNVGPYETTYGKCGAKISSLLLT